MYDPSRVGFDVEAIGAEGCQEGMVDGEEFACVVRLSNVFSHGGG